MFNAGVRGKRAKDSTGLLTVGEHFNQQNYLIPTVTRFAVTDGSYVETNDTAADTAGNQTIVVYGSSFAPGATILVGSTTISVVTFLDSGRLAFTSPALGSGSYAIIVTNANGGTGILVPGLVYSGVPTFTTAAGSLGSVYETTAINTTVVATGDAPITYALSSGSLPPGSTLSSGGTISGTAPVDGSSTTYSFTIQATDAEFQDSVRSFSLTINTDVVSFSSPANNTTTTITQNTPISNVTVVATSAAGYGVLYTSSGLPTGLSMNTSTGIISGTPTVAPASNVSIITATANTTNRTATRYLNWTVNLQGDLFWKYAALLMTANTVSTGNTFNTDLSTYNNEVVVVGDTKPNGFNPFKEGYYSNYFDGSGDYLEVSLASLSNYSGDLTIESWFCLTGSPSGTTYNTSYYIVGAGPLLSNPGFDFAIGSTAIWFNQADYTSRTLSGNWTINYNWNHIAVTRSGNTWTMWLNGTSIATSTSSTACATISTAAIGRCEPSSGEASGYMNGYITNLRVTKSALYSTTFTPSTTPLTYTANTVLLTCQSNRLIDNSNNNFTITKNGDTTINSFSPFNGTPTSVTVPAANNYSMYFDGTGDYLSVSGTPGAFGTGAYTVELWIYFTGASQTGEYDIIDSTGGLFQLYIAGSSSGLRWGKYGVGGLGPIFAAGSIPTNTWTHIAISRVSTSTNQTYYFANGLLIGTTTDTNNYSGTICTIGGRAGSNYYTGYISNLRMINGTALYTSAFTPSTTPLTAITNTSLLTCQANTVIDNSTNAYSITTSGDARPTRNGPFANTTTVTLIGNEGSAYFDGTGDYLTIPNNPSHAALGTLDFTLELWFNQTVLNVRDNYLISHRVSNYAPFLFWINSTGSLRFYASSDLGSWNLANDVALSAISLNTWNHFAYTRNGSTFRVFLNGAQVYTFTSSATFTTATTALNIGGQAGGTDNFTGYVSNARFVKGTALYTTPFVPSWTPLTPVANTVLLTAQTNLSSNTKVIVDESSNNSIVLGNGNVNSGSFSPFGSTWSVYFDGTGDYLSGSSSQLNFGANDFSIEFWMWPVNTSTNSQIIFQAGSGNLAILLMTGGIIEPGQYQTAAISDSTAVITAGAWHHVVVTRTGTSYRTFINGILRGYGARSFSPNNSSYTIGGASAGTAYTGYISNFKVIANSIPALYTTSSTTLGTTIFTTPTVPFVSEANTVLLTCNSNRFVDYSAANNVITRTGDAAVSRFSPFSPVPVTPASYSGYFDGTGDGLVINGNAGPIGTEDFTWECYAYISTMGGSFPRIFESNTGASGSFQVYLSSGTLTVGGNGTGTITSYSIASLTNQWLHLCITRTGSAMRLFVNGVLRGYSASGGNNFPSGGAAWRTLNEGGGIIGYLSNMRVVRGSIVSAYSTSSTTTGTTIFTPPTSPLTAIANTQLLTCQSTSFIDNSNNAFTITVTGDAKPVIQNPFTDTVGVGTSYSANTYGNSIYFDGTTDYLTVPYSSNFNIPASTPFTFECWAYTTSTNIFVMANRNWAFGSTGSTWGFGLSSGTTPFWSIGGTGASTYNMLNAGLPGALGQWNHYAWTRDSSNVCRVYTNGIEASSVTRTDSQAMTSASGSIFIGVSSNLASAYANGYMSNMRFLLGQCLYTSNFIPSNQPLPPTSNTVLLLSSTSGPSVTDALRISNMETTGTARQVANNSPYYDTYSGYFDGTGDYLTFGANQANLGLGTGDFTFEFWFNAATIPTTEVDIYESQTTNSLRVLKRASSAGLSFDPYGGTATLIMADASITTNTWHHVAISRTSGTTSAYYDGTRVVNQADSTNYATPTVNYGVGGRASGANYLNGYISNMRLVKGTGLYSGTTITVPTGPLTAVTNTQLLICNTNSFVDKSTNAFTITKNGDAKISALQPFTANNTSRYTSVYFPAKTDYLAVRPQPSLTTFPGDFTFECWVYPTDTTLTSAWSIWDSRQAGATANPMIFSLTALASPVTGSWRLSYYNGTQYYGTGTVLWNQWTHVAFVRSGTTMTFYVNGVAGGTATISGTQTGNATTAPIYIGSKDNGLANYGTVGYIADFRITNGYARTITVPTAPYDIK